MKTRFAVRTWICFLAIASSVPAAELCFELHGYPRTADPLLAADESAEAIRYLTEGVLIRINRRTQQPEPELAESWKVENHGARVVFQLRSGVRFPDGTPFTSADVVQTFRWLLDPALHAPAADTFKSAKGAVRMRASGPLGVVADFPSPVPGIERMFDQVAIMSHRAASRPAPGLGPFLVAARISGVSILLKRNPYYWKRDATGRPLPRLDSIRLEIDSNRDLELLRFRRGEVQLIDKLTPDLYDRLAKSDPSSVNDAGPSFDSEFLWFNQAGRAPLRPRARAWFQSAAFRRALSSSINRADLARVVYRGHASPAAGLISPANKLWFNTGLVPPPYDPAGALRSLEAAGFRLQGGILRDAGGQAVEFSLITNSGSTPRERMAAMIQQDLARLGIQVHIVTLDFPSLIERISRSLDYEACLLGLVNVDPDPNELMNVLLSSASNHPWNPAQPSPSTPWEAEIDRLMLAQAASADPRQRKRDFDRVQEILQEESPLIALLHPNALVAVSGRLIAIQPTAFFPHTFWDADEITFKSSSFK